MVFQLAQTWPPASCKVAFWEGGWKTEEVSKMLLTKDYCSSLLHPTIIGSHAFSPYADAHLISYSIITRVSVGQGPLSLVILAVKEASGRLHL